MISCADGWYILVFDSFNVCYNTKVHDIIKVEKEERGGRRERCLDARREGGKADRKDRGRREEEAGEEEEEEGGRTEEGGRHGREGEGRVPKLLSSGRSGHGCGWEWDGETLQARRSDR